MKYPLVNKKLHSYWKSPPVWYRAIIEFKLIFIESGDMGFVLYNALDCSNDLIQFNISLCMCNVNKALLSKTDFQKCKPSMSSKDVLLICSEINGYIQTVFWHAHFFFYHYCLFCITVTIQLSLCKICEHGFGVRSFKLKLLITESVLCLDGQTEHQSSDKSS